MRNRQALGDGHRARFGRFEANLATGELFRDGKRISIQEKPFSLLCLLLRHESFITRDEVFARLWQNVFVQKDLSLNTAIRRLRIALEDNGSSPQLIETIGSRGYRLNFPVQWLCDEKENQTTTRKRLAVVPFTNLKTQSRDFFSDGMTEEAMVHLGRSSKNMAVIAPLSSLYFKHKSRSLPQIAQDLQADFVLSGTVSRLSGSLRVTARLIRASDQACVWTQSYVREGERFFAVQREIAKNIAKEIVPAIIGSRSEASRARRAYGVH